MLFFGINIVRLLFLSLSFIKFSLSVFFFAQIKTTNVVSSYLVPLEYYLKVSSYYGSSST